MASEGRISEEAVLEDKHAAPGPWRQFRALFFILAGAVVTIIIVGLIGEEYDNYTVDDQGFVQLFGLGMVSLACLSSFWFSKSRPASRQFYRALGYILLIYALREADVHKAFVEHTNATKGEFYTDSTVPLLAKICCGAVLALFGIVFTGFIVRHAKAFVRAVLSRQSWALYVVAWGFIFVASQAIDKSDLNNIFWGEASEETLEMAAEAITLFAVLAFPHRPRAEKKRS